MFEAEELILSWKLSYHGLYKMINLNKVLQNAILPPVMLCHHLYMSKGVFPSSLKYLYNNISVFMCLWKKLCTWICVTWKITQLLVSMTKWWCTRIRWPRSHWQDGWYYYQDYHPPCGTYHYGCICVSQTFILYQSTLH